ncbi:MAG: ribosome biogenesis GTPase Der [Dehalococcoidia bacterium]|nr:ribosome biogenesis GTPase Der [Dehalococcoidia bacterium]
MSASLPVIAIVGRPNVGKSMLFNRLLGRRAAIVSEVPGTTRDRLVGRAVWDERAVLLMDTGGLQTEHDEGIPADVRRQVEVALQEADLTLLVVDVAVGLHPYDFDAADLVRRTGKPVMLAANKAEGKMELATAEFYRLGLGEPLAVSALHNRGIEDLKEQVLGLFPPVPAAPQAEPVLRLALMGRPNVGKSSLLNAIVGQERAIVHEEPGTTRDVVEVPAFYEGQAITLLDTAGVRRRGRIQPGIEKYSLLRVLQAVEQCNVGLLVLDAAELVTAQDAHVAGILANAHRGIVVVVNKWDLAPALGLTTTGVQEALRRRLGWASYVPVCFTSAPTGQGVKDALGTAWRVFQERRKQVPQEKLDAVLKEAIERHPPSQHPAHTMRMKKLAQVQIEPPTFVCHVNLPQQVHFSYRRFLENELRRAFGFEGTPIRLVFTKGPEARGRRAKG